MKQLVDSSWRFLRVAIHPPAQKRQQASGQGKSASSQFPALHFGKTPRFPEALFNPASKVAFREIEKIVETARVGQRSIDPLLTTDVREHLRHRDDSMRLFLASAEGRAHRFQESLQLIEEQVVLVAEVKIKGGTTDRRPIQHFLDRYIIDRLLLDQFHQSATKPLMRTPDARIGLSPLPCLFHFSNVFAQFGALISRHQ